MHKIDAHISLLACGEYEHQNDKISSVLLKYQKRVTVTVASASLVARDASHAVAKISMYTLMCHCKTKLHACKFSKTLR